MAVPDGVYAGRKIIFKNDKILYIISKKPLQNLTIRVIIYIKYILWHRHGFLLIKMDWRTYGKCKELY